MGFIQLTFIPRSSSAGGDVRIYRQALVEAESDFFEVNHNFNLPDVPPTVSVTVCDEGNNVIHPDEVIFTDGNIVTLNLASFRPLPGDFAVIVIG